jgi:hypothetical protein
VQKISKYTKRIPIAINYKYKKYILFLFANILLCWGCAREQGCTDPSALNFNPDAEGNDGSCVYQLAELPTTYAFSRYQSSSVNKKQETVTQLRIADLYALLRQLGETGATADIAATLVARYTKGDDQAIVLTTGTYAPLQDTYNDIASGVVLRSRISNTYGADSLVSAWLDTIAIRAQLPQYIATPAVYTLDNGIDLAEWVCQTLRGAVLYAQGTSRLKALNNANNADLVSGTNYTAMEQQWDGIAGLFGLAIDDTQHNPNQAFFDADDDGTIDYDTEYAYSWAQDALVRSAAAPDTDFRTLLEAKLIEGRAAITGRNDTLRIAAKNEILRLWEQLAAANTIHYANNLLALLPNSSGAGDPNLPFLNKAWAALRGSIETLRYKNGHALSSEMDTLLALVGNTPPHAAMGTPENTAAQTQIAELKQRIGNAYSFSAVQLQNW